MATHELIQRRVSRDSRWIKMRQNNSTDRYRPTSYQSRHRRAEAAAAQQQRLASNVAASSAGLSASSTPDHTTDEQQNSRIPMIDLSRLQPTATTACSTCCKTRSNSTRQQQQPQRFTVKFAECPRFPGCLDSVTRIHVPVCTPHTDRARAY